MLINLAKLRNNSQKTKYPNIFWHYPHPIIISKHKNKRENAKTQRWILNTKITKQTKFIFVSFPLPILPCSFSLALFVLFLSEVTPSLLHRYSIVTPSKRWIIDGLSMDYWWIILWKTAVFQWQEKLSWKARISWFAFAWRVLANNNFCQSKTGCWLLHKNGKFLPENKKNIKIKKKVEKSGVKWGKMCNFERKFHIK